MNKEMQTILIVDDEEKTRKLLTLSFSDKYNILTAKNGKDAIKILKSKIINLVFTDLKMPDMTGLELLAYIQKNYKTIPVILITAFGSIENAVEAMKLGAIDYIPKPINIDELEALIEKSLNYGRLLNENTRLKAKLKEYEGFNNIISVNPQIKKLKDSIAQVAKTEATVLIEGESGTGKQLFAQAVHSLSERANKSFIEINCGAIPHDLLESELFGHEKGAFTGAVNQKIGKFEQADGGTLFLDEIGELPLDLQVKLLHAVESQRFTRVGGTKQIETNIRIIAATNRNLKEEIDNNNFRLDLYYRLRVVNLKIPALKERKEDIPLLIEHFIKKHKSLNSNKSLIVDPEFIEILKSYDFPGNIRELENIVQQSMVMASNGILSPDLLQQDVIDFYSDSFDNIPLTKIELQKYKKKKTEHILNDIESKFLINLLQSTNGNISKAAEISGYDRRQIQNLINKHEINTAEFKANK